MKTKIMTLLLALLLFPSVEAVAASAESLAYVKVCDLPSAEASLRNDLHSEVGNDADASRYLLAEVLRRQGDNAQADAIGAGVPKAFAFAAQWNEALRVCPDEPNITTNESGQSSTGSISFPQLPGGITLLSILIAIFVIVFVPITCIRIVSQQTVQIVETFGRYSRTLTSGINFIFFPVQWVAGTVSLKIESIKADVEIKTSDNQFVKLPVDLMVQVREASASDAFYKLEDPRSQIRSWVLNTVRSTAAGMTLQQMFEDKDTIVGGVREALEVKLAEFGYRVENVLIDQPTVSESVQDSFNRVVAATRDKEAAVQEGEAAKIRLVKQAEAESEAQKRRAEGLSESRKILAKGLQESLEQFSGVPAEEAIRVLIETNRIDAIRDVGKHGNLILMDIHGDASSKALLPLLKGSAGGTGKNAE